MTSTEDNEQPTDTSGDAVRVARLERRLGRERAARQEAEQIAESGMRDLWRANQELEVRVAQRTAELSQSLAAATMATQAKERFLAELGHELVTPLHAVLGILELTDPETLSEANLIAVRTHAMQLARLLHSLVELAGAEGAPSPEAFETRRPIDWLDEVVGDWTKRAATRGQLLVPTTQGSARAMFTDWPRLRLMLDAVMSNVTTHAAAGAVNISLSVNSDNVVLSVADAGPGMNPDQVATALEPFVSSDTSAGAGIGLTVADRLARAAGGGLELLSDHSGTTVTMMLPATEHRS